MRYFTDPGDSALRWYGTLYSTMKEKMLHVAVALQTRNERFLTSMGPTCCGVSNQSPFFPILYY